MDSAFIVLYFTCSHSMHDCLLKFYFIAFVTMVALSTNVLGYDTTLDQPSWCWINPSVTNALFWQFFTGKFWEIISYIATVVLYSIVKCFIWKKVISLYWYQYILTNFDLIISVQIILIYIVRSDCQRRIYVENNY